MIQNQATYDRPEVAAIYAAQSHLQPAEATILELMRPKLAAASMLDLGVGGGRTTVHFAKRVRAYVGADYSEVMVKACRARFAGYPAHISFKVCDARSMDMFPAGSFDLILFSHNGIDYVGHEDRLKILREIRRVGKPGATVCFSSHNLNWCANLFELRRLVSLNPRRWIQMAKRLGLRFVFNPHVRTATVRSAAYLVFNDGAHRRKLLTYYVRPREQIRQLQPDFGRIRVFSHASGAEITDASELDRVEDRWLYYLCEAKVNPQAAACQHDGE